MDPTPFSDIRTIWFSKNGKPHATTDYEMLLERDFDLVAEYSISRYPNLWNPDGNNADEEKGGRNRQSYNYLSPSQGAERIAGHYCVIKPFPPHLHDLLREIGEPYGCIVETKITKSKVDGSVMGILDFKNKQDAERAAKAINGSEVGEVILSARYMEKKKRTKILDLIADRQSQVPTERKKQPFSPQKISGAEYELLTDLCQQWACFSDMYGSFPLSTLIWNLSAKRTPPMTTVNGAVSVQAHFDKEIENTLSALDKEYDRNPVRKLKL